MSRKVRRLIFYLLAAVFAISGTTAAFYSNGWRLDTSNFTFHKTGAIFIRVQPREAEISIDGKKAERSNGFLLSGTLIKNLLPGDYEVTINADGFKSWNNALPVKEGVVTEIKDTVLAPEEVPNVHLASTTAEMALAPLGLAITNNAGKLTYQDRTLSGSKFIGATADPNRVVTYNGRQDTYLWNDLRERLTVNLNIRFRAAKPTVNGAADGSGIRKIIPDPNRTSVVIVTTNKAVYRYNVDSDEVEIISAAPANSVVTSGNEFILDRWEDVIAYNFDSRETRSIMTLESKIKKMEAGGEAIIALGENGALMYYTPAKEAREIAHSVTDFTLGPNNQIAFREKDGQFNVYYPTLDLTRRTNALGEKGEFKWIGTRHLLIIKPEQTLLAELTDPAVNRDEPALYAAPIINEPVSQLEVDSAHRIYFITEAGMLNMIDYFDDLIK